jgi:hypothetical protein|tara:strand:- start:161 stop:598 length:438 start_codon:yes stop_codon:yes gene_type:complete
LKLEEIQELWNRDREIDISELATESIRIPQIHDKYLKIYVDEKIKLRKLQLNLAKISKMKSDYYSGRMSQEELDRLEWQPFLVKVLKGEVNSYVESDDDIIKLKETIALMEEKINYIDSVIRMINNRGFQIKSAIDWIKYKDGIS